MIIIGQKCLLKVCCVECGQPGRHQDQNSEFFLLVCQNKDCKYAYCNIVIEKKSGIVISCDAQFIWTEGEFRRVYPALYAEIDGEMVRVWPNKNNVDSKKQMP